MTEHPSWAGDELNQLLQDLPVGPAPVSGILRGARRRRRQRAAVLAGASLTVLVLGGTSIATGLATPDTQRPTQDPTPATPVSTPLRATVESLPLTTPPRPTAATYDAESGIVRMTLDDPARGCTPDVDATTDGSQVTIFLSENRTGLCLLDLTHEVVLDGVAARPTRLTVMTSPGSKTYDVPVRLQTPAPGSTLDLTATVTEGRTIYAEGAALQITLAPAASPRRVLRSWLLGTSPEQSWTGLEPGRYVLTGSTHICPGGAGCFSDLTPPVDTCTAALDLSSNTSVTIGFTTGKACRITRPGPAHS